MTQDRYKNFDLYYYYICIFLELAEHSTTDEHAKYGRQ